MGEAGFVCPRCAEPMQHLSWGEYGCRCGERVYAAGYAREPAGAAAVPSSPAEVERWLRAYPAWLETLEGAGYYGVAPEMGSRVQSNRTGRPTERTALLFGALVAQCRAVDEWWSVMDDTERALTGWFQGRETINTLMNKLGATEWQIRVSLKRLPGRVWGRVNSIAS